MNIPQNRLILYLMVGGLLPILFALVNIMTKTHAMEDLRSKIKHVQEQALIRDKKQSVNMMLKEHYKDAEHFYIDKHLESLTFLEPEIEVLQKLINNRYFAGDENVRKRVEFLTGPNNCFLFSESNIQTYPFFKETTDSLVHPVEVNISDLQKILTLIEGQPIGSHVSGPKRPQLMIIDFKLDKKEATDNNDVFLLNLKLLKREYL